MAQQKSTDFADVAADVVALATLALTEHGFCTGELSMNDIRVSDVWLKTTVGDVLSYLNGVRDGIKYVKGE